MKKLLFLFIILTFATGVYAQDSSMQVQDTSMSTMNGKKKDCYLMKEGKLMVMKKGDSSMMREMKRDVTLNNGAKLATDGTVTMTDGTKMVLKEGWTVDADGKMAKMKMPMKDDKL
jgi:hypothetical protein